MAGRGAATGRGRGAARPLGASGDRRAAWRVKRRSQSPASQRWTPVTAAEIVARAGRGPFAARQAAGAFGPKLTRAQSPRAAAQKAEADALWLVSIAVKNLSEPAHGFAGSSGGTPHDRQRMRHLDGRGSFVTGVLSVQTPFLKFSPTILGGGSRGSCAALTKSQSGAHTVGEFAAYRLRTYRGFGR
jgi:hypothetical protein